jgi:hypothetical protein
MNERIRELSKQAYELQRHKHGGYFTQQLLLDAFAELIVAECINMIEAEATKADEDDAHGMRNAAGLIGRAFITLRGVEE